MWQFHEVHLLRLFPQGDWERLTPTPYPRFYRGLPRLFLRGQPSQSKVAEGYSHAPTLMRTLALKAIVPLYLDRVPRRLARVYCEQEEVASLLSPHFPSVDFLIQQEGGALLLRSVPLGLHSLEWGLLNTDPPFEINPDLLALAQNRLRPFPETLRLLRLAWEQKLHKRALPEGEWVEEWAIQSAQLRPLPSLEAELLSLGEALEAQAGLAVLGRLLRTECSALPLLKGLTARLLLHADQPALAAQEEDLFSRFLKGQLPFAHFMSLLRSSLAK